MTLPRSNRRLTLRTATVLLALVALAILLVGTPTASADEPPQAPESGPVFDIQSLPLEGKVSPSKYLNLDSNLNHVVEQARTGRLTTRAAAASAPIHHGHSVAVTLYIIEGYSDAINSYLEANGASPRNIGADYIEVYIPVSLLEEASRQEGVLSIRTIIPPQPEQGTVVSGGVAAHGVTSWHAAGFKGRGVKIGVIDLSFEGFAGLMGSELPATVNARCYSGIGNFTANLTDCISTSSPESHRLHGTAVTEAIFDIAPQADYYIADTSSYSDLLNTVNWMASQGVDVINMSLGWTFDGPGDGTAYYSNVPLDSVDAAVTGGIIWVNAAGNSAKDSWYGAFEDSDSDGVHQFNASGNECNGVTIDLDPLEGFTAQLRWADSWGGANKDLDLYLIPVSGGTISLSDAVAASVDYQSGYINHIPYETFSRSHGQIVNGEYCLAVNQASGAAPSWIQLLVWGASGDLQNYVSAHSIGNPAESRNPGMLAAGAARVSNTSTIESFSSQGPTTDNRTKPDIVGADGGSSSTYGTWYGTSQASPHVAGLAALVKQAYPSRSPSSIASYLKDNALGRDTVPNNTWGYGFAQLPTPPTNSAATGVPTITGTAVVGATLTADTSGIVDLDGLDNVSFSYQWIRSEVNIDTDISGATRDSYTLVAADVGKAIKVRVSFDDDRNFLETLTSEATATVIAAVTPLTAEFQDAPDKHDGTGGFTFDIAFSEPISIGYVTLRDDSLDVTNGSATKARRVNGQSDLWEITVEPDSDADVTVVLPVTGDCVAQDAVCTRDGTKLSNQSEMTVPGPAAANTPATGLPTISGTAQVGETLTVDISGIDDADGIGNATFSYQWIAGTTDISGATGSSYAPLMADLGKTIKVRVSFMDGASNVETLTSEATATVVTPLTAGFRDAPDKHEGTGVSPSASPSASPSPSATRPCGTTPWKLPTARLPKPSG